VPKCLLLFSLENIYFKFTCIQHLLIEIIYFGKTKDIANLLRQSVKVSETRQKQLMQKQIGGSLGRS